MSTIKDRLPQKFKEEMKELLGDEYSDFLESYNNPRTNSIRINNLKIGREKFISLKLFDIDFDKDAVDWSDIGYYIDSDLSPGKNALHDAGAFYIQEPSAMSVVGCTDIKKNEHILDLCAAPGGKSTYILSKLENTGLLVSNEIDSTRIKALGENLERFGAINSIITNTDSKRLLTFFKGYFDKVFIDAPCSGQGMFRKDEYAINDWSESKVEECVSIQKKIIEDGFAMLKDGGMLIYSTCTFTKRENEDIIEEFLTNHSSAKFVNSHRIWPHKDRGEGHYCVRIIKMNNPLDLECDSDDYSINEINDKIKEPKNRILSKKNKKSRNNSDLVLYNEFIEGIIKRNSSFLKKVEGHNIIKKGNMIYSVPDIGIDLSGLKMLRSGICLGEIKKNRFEPSHSLASALHTEDVNFYIDFENESKEIKKYILGESIETGKSRGWILVTVDGVSIGWGKESNGVLKNKYPKGLRRAIK